MAKAKGKAVAVLASESLETRIGSANVAILATRPRMFRAMLREIGVEKLDVLKAILDGTATEVIPMVVSLGNNGGSRVEMVTRGPTLAHKLKAIEILVNGGLKGVPADNDNDDEKTKRGIVRFPVRAEVLEVQRG